MTARKARPDAAVLRDEIARFFGIAPASRSTTST
jgi:hypothetical protein